MSFGFLLGAHPPQIGGFLADGSGQQAHARLLPVVEKHLHVQSPSFFELCSEIDGLEGLGIQIDHAGLMPIDEMRAGIAMPLYFCGGEIAAIAQHEVIFHELEFGCGGGIVFAVWIDGKRDESATDQIVNRLDPCVTNRRVRVSNAREGFEKRSWQLDDGAVLHQHPAVTAEVAWREFSSLDIIADFQGDDFTEQRFEETLEGRIETQSNGLSGGIVTMIAFNPGG